MPNINTTRLTDERLAEMAVERYEAARALAEARRRNEIAKQDYQCAWERHAKAVNDYDTLEYDLARGVSVGGSRLQTEALRDISQDARRVQR